MKKQTLVGRLLCTAVLLYCIQPSLQYLSGANETVSAVDEIYSTYNKNIRPPNNRKPIDVTVDVYVISLSEISEKTMDFTVNMYIRQRWTDARLKSDKFEGGILINNRIDDTWVPDLFIKNDKTSEKSDVTTLNSFLRVDDQGRLAYSLRVTSTIACAMQLARYPFDVQYCEMLFESYGHTTAELTFRWNEANSQPVEINNNIELPEHIIGQPDIKNCTKTYNTTGSFSCISVEFVFTRNVNYYIMGLFLPSILIVVLSWVAFWIDKSSTPGRVSLSLLTILTMQNQMSSTLSQLPKVSYIKLVDVWLTGCLAFVFAGFLEYALVNKLATQEREKRAKYSVSQNTLVVTNQGLRTAMSGVAPLAANQLLNEESPEKLNRSSISEESPISSENGGSPAKKKEKEKMGLADKVDYYSRILFPGTFLLFNLILWLCYLVPGM